MSVNYQVKKLVLISTTFLSIIIANIKANFIVVLNFKFLILVTKTPVLLKYILYIYHPI